MCILCVAPLVIILFVLVEVVLQRFRHGRVRVCWWVDVLGEGGGRGEGEGRRGGGGGWWGGLSFSDLCCETLVISLSALSLWRRELLAFPFSLGCLVPWGPSSVPSFSEILFPL